jgi:hypothetical protein
MGDGGNAGVTGGGLDSGCALEPVLGYRPTHSLGRRTRE